jgi:CubicO group peptidase (beta-lactamase class C family)
MSGAASPEYQADDPARGRMRDRLRSVAGRHPAPGLQWAAAGPRTPAAVVWTGIADACTRQPVGRDTVFLSASMTKVITAVLVLQMVDRGLLSLDTFLPDLLPEIPYDRPFTVGMTLAHTAGLPNPNPMRWVHDRAAATVFDEGRALDAVIASAPKLRSVPGAVYRYSNVGYWLLGRALERLSGLSYGDLVRDRITAALGVPPQDFGCEFPPGDVGARGHVRRLGLVHPVLRLFLPRFLDGCPGSGRWARLADLTMDGPAYGGIFATSAGWMAVLKDLLRPAPVLLAPASQDALLEPRTLDLAGARTSAFGLRVGAFRGNRFLSKPGGGPGFSANLRIYPDIGVVSVWMRNALSFSERGIERVSDDLDAALISEA